MSASAAAAQTSDSQSSDPSNPLAVSVQAQDTALKADAALDGGVSSLTTGLKLGVEADPRVAVDPLAPVNATASKESVGFNAGWAPASAAHVDLVVGDSLSQSWTPMSLLTTANHQVTSDDQSARLALTVSPLPAIDLSLSGAAAHDAVRDSVVADALAPPAPSLFATDSQSATAGVKWRAASWLTFDAKGQVDQASAEWRGAGVDGNAAIADTRLDYADFAPSVSTVVTLPWQDHLNLSVEHAVTPISAQTFSTYAAVEDRDPDARLGPGREWRYRLSVDQTVGDLIKLNAAVTEAQIESTTELGPVAEGLQAPVSTPGGQRQEMDLSFSAPLPSFGLPAVTLQGQGAWRDSEVRDPFTGEYRRASSESPMDATLGVVQSLPDHRTRWGLEGRFGGDQAVYQMSQVTMIHVADSVGGFVEYQPGPFALRLQVDGLYGGDRDATDVIFADPRSPLPFDPIDRVAYRSDSGQAIRLILRRSL